MISTEIPKNEDLRLLDLDSFDILDAETDADFAELIELTAQLCNCPVALISFLDRKKQWYKVRKAVPISQTLKDISFSTHVILSDDIMVVEDTKLDSRFFTEKMTKAEIDIRFFFFLHIKNTDGHRLGTICVIDKIPKVFSSCELNALRIMAGRVARIIELHKKNMLIRKMAEEIIVMKNDAITKTMNAQEEANKAIAINLHENMAQSVAACIHHLKIAENNQEQRLQQIQTVEQELKVILNNMRQLSYAIKPNTMEWVPVEELIKGFIEKIAESFPFKIQFYTIGNESSIPSEKALFIMRIIEHWLKNIENRGGLTMVKLTVITTGQFELLIEDDRPLVSYDELKKELFDSLVFEMVRSQSGIVDICHVEDSNLLQIILPDIKV